MEELQILDETSSLYRPISAVLLIVLNVISKRFFNSLLCITLPTPTTLQINIRTNGALKVLIVIVNSGMDGGSTATRNPTRS